MCLRTFLNTHFEVDTVAYNIHFGRLQTIEEVTVVPIAVAHGIFILCESLVEKFLVVHVALAHTEHPAQNVCRIHRVAHP